MKHLFNFNQLFMSWNEKQMPQRFGRYAVMLIMLLTLGVGQMWAKTVYMVANVWNDDSDAEFWVHAWNGTNSNEINVKMTLMDNESEIYYADVNDTNDKFIFVRRNKNGDSSNLPWSGEWNRATFDGGTDHNCFNVKGWDSYEMIHDLTQETVYFTSSADNVYVNVNRKGDGDFWNLVTMSSVGKTYNGTAIYTGTFNVVYGGLGRLQFKEVTGGSDTWTHIIGTGNANSWTTNLSTYLGRLYDGSIWYDYGYDVTLDRQGGTTGSTTIIGTVGSAMPSATMPGKTGYSFNGYFTGTSGSGSKYYNADGTSAHTFANNDPTTLYACWTAAITPSAKYTNDGSSYTTGTTGGTVTINGSSSATNVVEGATYTIVATPVAGYMVESVDVGSTNIYSNTARATGTYNNSTQTADTAATVTVKFAKVKDITVYVYVGDKNTGDVTAASVEMNGCTPYVGGTACSAQKVNVYTGSAPKFTLTGNWLTYTFTNVTKVTNITCARSGGNIFTGTITADKYIMYDGTALTGQCIPYVASWSTAPANGSVGGNMTAAVNTTGLTSPSVSWSSSNTDVATVNSSTGYIEYVATGTARITASISWSAGNDYCAGSTTKYEDITVASGATVSATRTCPAYVAAGVNGQVSMHITFTGTSSGWRYRVKHNWDTGYETEWSDASGTSADWTMTGGMGAGTFAYVVELYDGEGGTLIATSDPVSVTGETAFSTTIAAGSNGAVSPSGTVYANNSNLHPSITATPSSNYHFVNWTSDNNTYASVADDDETTTTVTATEAGHTITANFAGDQYTITYKDQGNVAFSGSHVESPSAHPTTHTYGTATSLNSATKTGYTFGGWFTTSNCASGTDVTSLGATAYTNNITLYAKWTEIMSDLSTSCSYDVGDPSYSAPTVSGPATDVGYTTTRTITATAAGTGYTFTGWTLTNCTRTDGGGTTANPITICSNGDGAAASVVANYEEDLSTGWTICGGSLFGGTAWEQRLALTKKSGHSTESVGYYTISISGTNADGGNTNYNFKVQDPSDHWFGLATTDHAWDWLYKRDYGTQPLMAYGTNNDNVQICSDIAGNYEIKVDYSTPASPTVTITFPTTYTLTYSIGSVAGTDGSITSSPSTSSGSKVVSGNTVTLTAPSEKTGYTWKGWYLKSDGSGVQQCATKAYAVTMDADKTLYACYTETTYTVAFNNGDHGTVSPSGDQQVGAGGKTITATPASGWMFDNWTKTGANVTLSSTTTNPTTVTAASTGSVTANYKHRYILRGSIKADGNPAGGMAGWSANNNSSYASATIVGNMMTITANLTAASTEYKFMIRDIKDNVYKGQTGTGSMSDGDTWTLNGTNDVYFTTTIAGTYTFAYNVSTGSMTITYPTTYVLNYSIGSVAGTNGSISCATASGSYVGSGNSVTLTAPAAKTGYEWSGWFTNAAGTMGKINDVDRAITVTMDADKTLYACYTENEYNTTVSAGANGSVSPSGTVNIKQITGTSLTATPNSGYRFVDWTISGGGINPGSSTSSPQNFTATSTGGSIQANFAENMHTVTVASNNTAFGTVSPTSVSAGIATASETITATPATGATFTGWTGDISNGVTIASGTASSTSITIRATADSKSITANFTEDINTVTLSNQNSSYGDVNTSSPVSVGQITAVQIRATPKSGYMFAGWVKTAGTGTVTYHTVAGTGAAVDPTGNTQATTYITVDGDVTLQATWDEDRSSGWFMRGVWTDGWSETGEKPFIKNVGETTGTVSHVRWTLDPRNFDNAILEMKVYDGSKYWAHWSVIDASENLCTKASNNSNIGFYQDDNNKNFRISIEVYGEYDFEWDSSTKQLTVHYPNGNFIRGDFNSWGWEDELTTTGVANEYAGTITLAANQTWSAPTNGFKAVILGDHYGKDGTTITRANNSANTLSTGGANIGMTTDVAGNYTFTINTSTKNLSVTYPTAYTVTFGYGTGGSAVTASATSRAGSFASGGYVASGDNITFSQTPAAGYTFKGWYTTADGNTEVSTMGESDNVLNGLSGDATVYAQYTPTTYTNVTLNATTGSTNGAYSVTFGGTAITVTTEPLKTGYEPEGYYYAYADGNWTEKIATAAGQLQTGTNYTDGTGHWKATNSPTLYTKWQPKTYTITLHDNNGGSHNGSVTATYDAGLSSPTAPTRTGYHVVDGYYKEAELTNKIINVDGTLCASTAYTDASSHWTNDGAVTLYAKWAPNNYTITFAPAGGSVDPTSASVTFDAAISNAPVPEKTGYDFTGYNTEGGASITTNTGVFKASVDGFTDGSAHWVHPDHATITAQWSAKTYTITLTQSGETGYGSAGTASVTATYDAALPTIASLPTAANGYAFMGYFTGHNGEGTQYYGADGTKMVASYTTADGVELFAYFKKAEITLAFDNATVLPEGEVGVTPTISPTPVGNVIICWTILYNNDNPLDPQPAMTWDGTKLTFMASSYSGTYKVQAVLRTGTTCDGGTELDTETASFMVAGKHNVTVEYKDASGNTLQASTTLENVDPMDWSEDITAPEIFGYTFARWDAADGVTIKNGESDPVTTSTEGTIQIKATYDGKLTAVYTQNNMIFFKNTLGWSNVYVNFYSDSYWNNPKGSGNQSVAKRNLAMTRYGETDIWYYDYGAADISPSLYVSFTSESQNNTEFFWKSGGVNVVYPANYQDDIHTDKKNENGFKAATPMFVPLATQEKVTLNQDNGGKADYYNAGYWTKYLPGTGYRLEIYNNSTGAFIKGEDFTSADELMPMKAVLDLEGGTTYKFQLRRGGESSAGIYYGNTGTMTYSNHGQGTPWAMTNDMTPSFQMAQITTNTAGDYTFNLSYSPNASNQYRLRIAVDYPVADGDYRLVYSDAVQTKPLASAIVTKENDGSDIVSFFVRPSSTPVLRIQQATVAANGTVTWKEYPTNGTPTNQITGAIASAITSGGTEVYNFNLSMNGSGELIVASVEKYEGNFYIRTDAANSKWDNYKTDPDHLMTYSEYSIEHGGYTHYYCHWVNKDVAGRKNVKFVVANDYSPNISDTLVRETASGTWANIDNFMTPGGDLKRNANVRFMWNKNTNEISRAYVDGAQGDGSGNFLYMLNMDYPNKIRWDGGSALTSNKVTFTDKGNWMYEANIEAQPTAQIRLLSNWGTSPIITQYFRGSSSATEELVGGSGSTWYDIRVIYDFKTNRLIAGLVPSGTIDDQIAINADVMFIREHQGDIAQLTFAEKDSKMGAITNIETAYGVLQFNKWTINNKSKEAGHSPLTGVAALSRYERDLFYVSFPFKVAMEEVFGFGTYGQHWIIEYYDGAGRAANGYWQESGPNWKFVTNRKGKFFEPGQGYIIALDLDELGESSSVWANTDQVELYFPSYGTMPNITSSKATYEIPGYECTINRTVDASGNPTGLPAEYDRRVRDSHWNVLGVPTYVNPDAPEFANTDWTTEASETSIGPNFLYEWNMSDNSVSAVSASGYTYHAMHAYLVQYCGNVTWTASVSPATAPRRNPEYRGEYEFRLQMLQDEKEIDQAYVKLSDDERVTTGFEFNYDLSKEFNKNKANIYTMIGAEPVAGNVLPLTEQTTVVPVGVKTVTDGDYTFSMPDGTEGIGVTLIDTETGIRTSLSALDYTVNLSAGTYENRFVLEISPIVQTPTSLEEPTSDSSLKGRANKVMIDGIMYIVKDGKLFDARGARVQ